jgi:hypothetical protein
MSKTNQLSSALLIANGADIEALDTYGKFDKMSRETLALFSSALCFAVVLYAAVVLCSTVVLCSAHRQRCRY